MKQQNKQVSITLQPEEIDNIEQGGQERHNTLAGDIDTERTASASTSTNGHILGYGVEYAVAQYYSVDMDVGTYAHGDDGIDHTVELYDHPITIDAKHVSGDWRLRRVKKSLTPDYILFGRYSPNKQMVQLFDWIRTSELVGEEIERETAIINLLCECENKDLLGHPDFEANIGGSDVRAWLEDQLNEMEESGKPITENLSVSKYGWINYRVTRAECMELPEPSEISKPDPSVEERRGARPDSTA